MNCVRFREALLNWVYESLERQVSFNRFVGYQGSKLSHKVKGAFHSKQNEDYIFCHRLFSKFIFVSWSLRWWLLCGEWSRKGFPWKIVNLFTHYMMMMMMMMIIMIRSKLKILLFWYIRRRLYLLWSIRPCLWSWWENILKWV